MQIEGYTIEMINETNFRVLNALENVSFEYRYETEYKLAIQTWYGFMPYQKVIEVYLLIAQYAFMHKQPIFGSLTDLRQQEGSFDESNDWLINEYMPKAVKYGFKYAATVRPQDFYAQLALEEVKAMNQLFHTKDFENFDEAYQWVTSNLSNLNQV